MKSLDVIRTVRLIAIISLIPFVRSCDDATGLTETIGFPLSFAHFSNGNYDFSNFSQATLLANLLFLILALALLFKTDRHIFDTLVGIKVFVILCASWLLFKIANAFVFVPLIAIAVAFDSLSSRIDTYLLIDILARALLVISLTICVVVYSREK